MKVLLVGGLGFIGKRFIKKNSEINDLVIYARHENVLKTNPDEKLKNVIIEEGDVENKKIFDVILKHKPDVVIHLAALTGLMKCYENPDQAFKINVYGTFNVINACIKTGSKLIFTSSREVYGETLNYSSAEDDPLLPNNTYGITKMLGEILIKQEGMTHNLEYTILRRTNVYGPHGQQYGPQVIIKKAVKENKMQILGGDQLLNYVYVDDVVEMINLALDDKRTSRQVFNVGSKDTISIREFAEKVIQIMGRKVEIQYLPMRETETSNFRPNLAKINSLGFETKTTLESGLRKTIDWYSN